MALVSGTRLGPYEILSAIGAGGMGEVYRARDRKLDRDVAIKVLPESFATDPDRLARFEREAKTLASLNHPNIAHIHGLEEADGVRALVMELVEGEDLSQRIARGAIPLDEALPIAKQIAEALEAAHERGIIHRDLKPANVKVREDGVIKVLDFGLAKAMEAGGASRTVAASTPNLTNSPTLASPALMTGVGMILGTAAYMSPEQARGKPADQRADIWAFGCVLFEMLAGRQVFGPAETVSDAVVAILTRDPDWTALPADLPPSLRTLLRRCLQRDPDRRLHHIADARLDLDDAINTPVELSANAVGPGRASTSAWKRALPWAVTALALGVGAAGLWTPWRWAAAGTPEAPAVRRLELNLPAGVELFATTSRAIALSPDGARLAFIGVVGGSRQIYIRPLDQFDAIPLRGSDTAVECLFSPDGKSIGLLTAAGVLKAISLADGQVTTVIDDVDLERGAAWSADDSLVFGRGGTLWRIPRSGGAAKQLTTLGGPRHDTFHEWPSVLPGGKAILFAANSGDQSRIESVNLATGERQVIVERGTYPIFTASGRLVFFRDGELLAAPFDPIDLKVTGPSVQVLSNLVFTSGAPVMDVSASGVLAYAPTTAVARLVWVSRQGIEQPANDVPRAYTTPRLAIDGNRVLVQAGDLWIQDLARATFTRLTSKDVSRAGFPIWTPDGRRVVYRAPAGLRVQDADGSGQGQLIAGTNELDYPGAITPDGGTLVLLRSSQETSYDIYSTSLAGAANLQAIVKTPAYEGGARLSPDGRWLAYVSNESGQYETYLRPFPGPERRWQISTEGGTQIVWNPNGKEIFYRNGNKMMAVDVSTAPEVALSAPRLLFEQRYAYGTGITISNYDVSRDGQRFLMVKDESSAGRLNIVLNWFEELKSRAPTK